MCGVLAIAVANLWPRSEIIITSSTVAQGNKMAEKILNEIIKRNSPVLLYMYEKEYWVKTQRDDGWTFENKLNGSTIRVLPALDSSRGSRATMLIYEEARLIKFGIIQSVFRPMSHPRQAQYLTNPKYGRDERWLEDTKTVYLSSASYTFEWLYREWKRHVTDMYNNPESKTNVFAGDIFTSIDNGLKTIGDYNKAKKASTEESFAMEDLNQFIGEASDAFFTYKQFKENQTIERCFRPPTHLQFFSGEQPDLPPKKDDEVRLVVVDYAFSNTTGCTKNDNTIITLMSAHWNSKKNRFERHVDYIEGHDASDTIGAADRARYLWWTYNADYLCPDGRSGGEVLFNHMTEILPWPELGYKWNSHGLGLADKYQIVPQAKIDDYRSRVVDKDAIPAIIPLIGTPELNLNKIGFRLEMNEKIFFELLETPKAIRATA